MQLHGDEPPEFVGRLRRDRSEKPLKVLRALRIAAGKVAESLTLVASHVDGEWPPDALLVDAFRPGAYGGTGELAPWRIVRQIGEQHPQVPLILAGGLTPENVADALRAVGPAEPGVDVASGVESSPGIKDRLLVERFVAAARETA